MVININTLNRIKDARKVEISDLVGYRILSRDGQDVTVKAIQALWKMAIFADFIIAGRELFAVDYLRGKVTTMRIIPPTA